MNLNDVQLSSKFLTEAGFATNDMRCLYLTLLQSADRCGLLKVEPSEVWLRWRPDAMQGRNLDLKEIARITMENIREFERMGYLKIIVAGDSPVLAIRNYLRYQSLRYIVMTTLIPEHLLPTVLTYTGIYACNKSALASATVKGAAKPLMGALRRLCREQADRPNVALYPMPNDSTTAPMAPELPEAGSDEPVKRGRGRPRKSEIAVQVRTARDRAA